MVGRVSTRRKQRDEPRVQRAAQRNVSAELERRIKEAEDQKIELEQRLTEAFAGRKLRDGRRAERQLTQVTKLLDDLYSQWVEGE